MGYSNGGIVTGRIPDFLKTRDCVINVVAFEKLTNRDNTTGHVSLCTDNRTGHVSMLLSHEHPSVAIHSKQEKETR